MRNIALTSSVAALAAACSQNDYGARTVSGEASVSRSLFSESDYGVKSSRRAVTRGPVPKGGGVFKIGNPYKVAGRWYVPREDRNYDRVGTASWYGDDFHGRHTANGEIFDRHALTAAHPTMPLPSYAYVTNLANGRTVLVRVNDRGPYVNGRIIDLSHRAAQALGYVGQGRARVRVRYAGRAPLNGDDRRERQYLAQQESIWSGARRYAETAPAIPRPAPVAVAAYEPTPSRRNAYQQHPTWSSEGYRAGLAGKPIPDEARPAVSRKLADARRYEGGYETASIAQPQSAPYALAGPMPRASASRNHADTRAFVQFGYYRDPQYAERIRGQFGYLGPIEVAPLNAAQGAPVYRVRLGPVSAHQAESILREVKVSGIDGGSIVFE